jgi:hypothetical protein
MNIARIKMKISKPDHFYDFIQHALFCPFFVSNQRFFVYDIKVTSSDHESNHAEM